MAKFYVVGVTKYDPTIALYDVVLKLEDEVTSIEGDLRLQVAEKDVAPWVAKIGKFSEEFEIVFPA